MPGERVPDPYFGGDGPGGRAAPSAATAWSAAASAPRTRWGRTTSPWPSAAARRSSRCAPSRRAPAARPGRSAATGSRLRRSGAWLRKDRRTVTAEQVVFAAGAWGTQRLLHTLRVQGALPHLSTPLGELTRTNSEALGGAMTARVPGRPGPDPRGRDHLLLPPRRRHPCRERAATATAATRWGRWPRSWSRVTAGCPRPLRFAAQAVRHPVAFARSLSSTALERAHRHRPGDADPRQLPDRLATSRAARRRAADVPPGPRRAQPDLDPLRPPALRQLAVRLGERTGVPPCPVGPSVRCSTSR